MGWQFETEAEFQPVLDWMEPFVREEVEPIDLLIPDPLDGRDRLRNDLVRPLQDRVREKGLWACHLGPELGGQGFGQLRLALMNEIIGHSKSAQVVFGCQAPDSGNAEILAHYGSEGHRAQYLQPLLDGNIASCFAITEPQGGSDPTSFRCRAEPAPGGWVLNGEKWFASGVERAAFTIVMAVTDPDAARHRRMSMFIVPSGTPGVRVLRNVAVHGLLDEATHGYVRYEDVFVPDDHLLGERGDAFRIAQRRLAGGRIHHAMRTVGAVQRAFDAMCRRAVTREVRGERLADKQLVQQMVADSWIEMEQFRLLVLRTAWRIDQYHDYDRVRADIAAVKVQLPRVLGAVAARAVQVHGSLGVSAEMPLAASVIRALTLGIADGPTEVHMVNLAKHVLRAYEPYDGLFPPEHLPTRRAEANRRYEGVLADHEDALDGSET